MTTSGLSDSLNPTEKRAIHAAAPLLADATTFMAVHALWQSRVPQGQSMAPIPSKFDYLIVGASYT